MSKLFPVAVAAAVATSAIALYDAAHHGLTGRYSQFSTDSAYPSVVLLSDIVHGLNYAALATILVLISRDANSGRWQRGVGRLLATVLGVLAAMHLVGSPISAATGAEYAVLSDIGGIFFLLMFLLSFILGLTLLRNFQRRVSAVLLVAIVPVLLLTILAAVLGSGFAHPAYAETLVNLGLALLALPTSVTHHSPNPSMVRAA
ncbi:MAG TPA: hypothetical protein VF635_13300 [Propionibacteriaceae bacterium]|jgi:hypothetical protein